MSVKFRLIEKDSRTGKVLEDRIVISQNLPRKGDRIMSPRGNWEYAVTRVLHPIAEGDNEDFEMYINSDKGLPYVFVR